jgi:hypothetical protein
VVYVLKTRLNILLYPYWPVDRNPLGAMAMIAGVTLLVQVVEKQISGVAFFVSQHCHGAYGTLLVQVF